MILFVIRLSHISSPHNSTIDYHNNSSDDGSRHVRMVSVFFFLFSFLFISLTIFLGMTNILQHPPPVSTTGDDGGTRRLMNKMHVDFFTSFYNTDYLFRYDMLVFWHPSLAPASMTTMGDDRGTRKLMSKIQVIFFSLLPMILTIILDMMHLFSNVHHPLQRRQQWEATEEWKGWSAKHSRDVARRHLLGM